MTEFTVEKAKELINSLKRHPVNLREACEWLVIIDYHLAARDIDCKFSNPEDYMNIPNYVNGKLRYDYKLSLSCFKIWIQSLERLPEYCVARILDTFKKAYNQYAYVEKTGCITSVEETANEEFVLLKQEIHELKTRLSQLEKFCN